MLSLSSSRYTAKTTLGVLTATLLIAACGGHFDDGSYIDDNYHPGLSDEYHYGGDPYVEEQRGDDHIDYGENSFIETAEESTSSFSIDVNTASYTIMRRDLNAQRLPVPESVRIEEYINFFRFAYPEPQEDAFSINMELAPSYFGSTEEQERHLLRIGLKGKDVSIDEMKHNNLVFLVDVSGSMNRSDRMPLAKESMHVMLEYLRDTDTVAMQTYASGTETVLEPTPVSDRGAIENAIDSLVAHGGTFGEGGIRAAYDLAEQGFVEGANNRVIILTDGDFNVGLRGDDIVELVKSFREREISLTSVGYGHGGFNDATMERIARKGNGNYFYIDTVEEAHRIFGTELPSTLEVIAEDTRIQVVFDDQAVKRYRLIGYEKRVMDNEEFDDEDTNAGELGPGHTVTAFYEMELHEDAAESGFIAEVRVRHREQYDEETRLQSRQIKFGELRDDFDQATDGFRFAAAVAEFAGILRHSEYVQGARFDEILDVAGGALYDDHDEQVEFLGLVEITRDLWE